MGENVQQIERYDNLLERYKLREGYGLIEFLGNDIDAGFRIKKETENRRMVISFELAYILAKDTDYLKNIHIITYKTLRGIWQNRLYPITIPNMLKTYSLRTVFFMMRQKKMN